MWGVRHFPDPPVRSFPVLHIKQFGISIKLALMEGLMRRWQLLALLLIGLGLASQRAEAQENVLLTWNPDQTGLVTQYRVWYGTQSGNYTNTFTVGDFDNYELTGLQQGVTYYFAIQSMDQEGDVSPLSNEASYTIPILEPVSLQTTLYPGTTYLELSGTVQPSGNWELFSSPDLVNWTMVDFDDGDYVDYVVDMSQAPQLFFKVVRY